MKYLVIVMVYLDPFLGIWRDHITIYPDAMPGDLCEQMGQRAVDEYYLTHDLSKHYAGYECVDKP